jgi:hypothetical protein
VLGIGSGLDEEIHPLAVSHRFLTLMIFPRQIFVLILDEEKNEVFMQWKWFILSSKYKLGYLLTWFKISVLLGLLKSLKSIHRYTLSFTSLEPSFTWFIKTFSWKHRRNTMSNSQDSCFGQNS